MADYNINAVTRKVSYTGSAGVGPYAFSFEVLTETDLAVYFNATLLTLTTDYTVTINANGTGSITIVTGTNVPTTPDADDTIVIIGARDIERTTDFVTAGDLRASSLNEQLDSAVIFDQQISERVDRAILAPAYDPTGIDMTLPAKADRADKFLTFDSNGDVSTSALSGLSELIVDNVKIDGNTVTTISGDLNLTSTSTAVTIKADTFSVKNAAGSETIMTGAADGAVNLYYDNDVVLTTYSNGIDVNDAIKLDTFIHFDSTGLGAANFYIRAVPDVSDPTLEIRDSGGTAIITAHEAGRNVTFANNVTVGGNLTVQGTTTTIDSATVQTVDLGDSDEIRLGDSNDYSILYDETWPGLLIKRGSSNVIVNADGEGPLLYYNGTLVAQTNTNGMTLWEATDDALGGPNLILRRNSSTPADNDVLGQVVFYGESDTSALTTYALINASIVDATNATKSGAFHINVMSSGTETEIVQVDPTGIDVTGKVTSDELDVDNININGNAITSTDANGNIALTPNGTGEVDISKVDIDGGAIDGVTIGTNSAVTEMQVDNINIDGNTITATTSGLNLNSDASSGAVNLYYNAANKLSTKSNGVDITGELDITGDLKIDQAIYIENSAAASIIMAEGDTTNLNTYMRNEAGDFEILTINDAYNSTTSRFSIDHSTGDISFYEDTGTTAKMFWDASAESLGIGTTSPSFATGGGLHVHNATTGRIHLTGGASGTSATDGMQLAHINSDSYVWNYETGPLVFATSNAEAMRIDSSGNVGIGTSSPATPLVISNGGAQGLEIDGYNASASATLLQAYNRSASAFNAMELRASQLEFNIGSSEAMRIDSSGNLLVGKSVTTLGTQGTLIASGQIQQTKSAGAPLLLNRTGSGGTENGTIIDLRTNSVSVGSIGVDSSTRLYFTNSSGAGLFLSSGTQVEPMNNGSRADATMNIGGATYRFKDLYLSGGVYLGGTGSANHLDDYEEGTWTPAYTPETGSFTTMTYSNNTGTYTKIGRVVIVHFNIFTSNVNLTGASGGLFITGLPFTVAGDGGSGSIYSMYRWAFASDRVSPVGVGAITATTRIQLRKDTVNAASADGVDVTDLQTGSGTFRNALQGTIVYEV